MGDYLRNQNIVITGLQPWDIKIGSNCKDIAIELAKKNRVLYVNRSVDRISILKSGDSELVKNRLRVINGEEPPIKQISESIWVLNPKTILESINFLPKGATFDFLNRRNNIRIANQIRYWISKLDFCDIILFNDNDFIRSFYLPDILPHKLNIYYLRDNLSVQPYFQKRKNLEMALIKKSDFVFANSTFLAEYASHFNKNSFFVGQGFEQENFEIDDSDVPTILKEIKRPIIGYLGTMTSERLDVKLLEFIASALQQKASFALVGPEDQNFQSSNLHAIPNVHFLGAVKSEEASAYINNFDVCINPQLVNPLTIGNYPRKIDEYLILGKPVVATWTKTMDYFDKYTYLAKSKESFLEMLISALNENSTSMRKARIDFAKNHTWGNSVNQMCEAIESVQI